MTATTQIKHHCLQRFHEILLFQVFCFSLVMSYSQTGNPNTITFQPLNTSINVQPVRNSNNSFLPIQPPNATTAEDVIRQTNQNAHNNLNVVTPQGPPSDPYLRSQYIQQNGQQERLRKQQQYLAEIYQILNEDLPEYQNSEETQRLIETKYYKDVFLEIQNMQSGVSQFSLKRVIFLIENAWNNNTLDYKTYCFQIENKVNIIKNIVLNSKIEESNGLGYNYIIQKLFSEPLQESSTKIHEPFGYDFEDFMGEKDWSKMFVSKLLSSGKGQCHSLPLLYLILAEETKTKAWLSFAPEHSYIIFGDQSKHLFYNFETTNGNVVSNDWIMESGYVSTPAIRNRIYLDTLSRNQLIATLVADLTMGYTNKFGYDDFTNSMVDYILTLNPKSIQGHILKADIQAIQTGNLLKMVGNPPIKEIDRYPDAYNSYLLLLKEYDIIDALGYVAMPKEIYEQWLASANTEKQRTTNAK